MFTNNFYIRVTVTHAIDDVMTYEKLTKLIGVVSNCSKLEKL